MTAVPNVAIALEVGQLVLATANWRRSDLRSWAMLDRSADVLPLTIESAPHDQPRETTVQRVWLQTWQAGNTIQDRAAINFRTASTEVVIELLPRIVRDVEALVDGELAQWRSDRRVASNCRVRTIRAICFHAHAGASLPATRSDRTPHVIR